MLNVGMMSAALVLGLVIAPYLELSRTTALLLSGTSIFLHQLFYFMNCHRSHLLYGASACGATLSLGAALGTSSEWSVPAFKSVEHIIVGDIQRVSRAEDRRFWVNLHIVGAVVVDKDGAPQTLRPSSGEVRFVIEPDTAVHLSGRERIAVRLRGIVRRQQTNFGVSGVHRRPPAAATIVAGPILVQTGTPGERILAATKRAFQRAFRQVLEGQQCAFAMALVLGDRRELLPETTFVFRSTGAAHLLAVSGLHVSMVAHLTLALMTWLLLHTSLARKIRVGAWAASCAILVCWLYALVTGLAPPAFRAAVMMTSTLSAFAVSRPARAGRALWIAGALLLLENPLLLWRPGFQLSFIAVATLVGLRPQSAREVSDQLLGTRWISRLFDAVRRGCRAGIAVTLSTAPLIAHHFGQFSPWSVVVNLIAIPIMGFLILPGTIILAIVSLCSVTIGRVVALPVQLLLDFFLKGLRWASELPGACIPVARPSLAETLLLAFAGLFFMRGSQRLRYVALLLIVLAGLSIVYRFDVLDLDRRMRITFLDVGAGDSTLVELPSGRRFLIDAGPRSGTRLRTTAVVESLQRTSWGRLELLLLTHGHADHAAGMEQVLRDIGAKRFFSPLRPVGASEHPLDHLARMQSGLVESPATLCGTHEYDEVRLEVLHPCLDEAVSLSENSRSTVIRLVMGKVAVLLPGDIEAEAEELLLRNGVDLKATVLKLAHHGSNTSTTTEFIQAVDPQVAVASCSSSRRRVLPSLEVVARLDAIGAHTLSTDRLGAIQLETDGESVHFLSAREGPIVLTPLRPRPP